MTDEKRICLNQSVLDFMDSAIGKESIVLELGAGWSSFWFAERCGELFTVETHPKWVFVIENELRKAGFKNWQMIKCSTSVLLYKHEIENSYIYDLGTVDLALIDCREDLRFAGTEIAWELLKPGGWVLFDDAQRPQHKQSIKLLNKNAGVPVKLKWSPGDIESAKERLTLAWQKPL